jgi:hypothetical protein
MFHSDFRPGKRPRFVPSGSPRRRIPLIRIALLLAFGLFVYSGFDEYWPRLREAVNPAALWRDTFAQPASPPAGSLTVVWSNDSSRVTLECPLGLTGACCEALHAADQNLCSEATALLTKARWKRAIASPVREEAPLQLEARAVVSDLGDWSFELSGLRGRDPAGNFLFRRTTGSGAWCDPGRGCLGSPVPRIPLAEGRLLGRTAGGAALWIAVGPHVRAVLPGRIVAVDPVPSVSGEVTGVPGAARVRVYHGSELYTSYEPVRTAANVKPGALVKAGSHLGGAPRTATGYALTVRVRQAGQNLSPLVFWGGRGSLRDGPGSGEPGDLLYSGVSL